jgi:hypothetical protein
LLADNSTFVRGVRETPALLTHRPQSRLGERGGTPSTGMGWNDLDGWGGIMKRGRRRTCDLGRRGETTLGIRRSRIPFKRICFLEKHSLNTVRPYMRTNGRFYLKKTANGNLLGEWSNDSTPGIFTESCDLDGGPNQSFAGTYFSTWREGTEVFVATLIIEDRGNVFDLDWRGNNGRFAFVGQGMLRMDGVLEGDYHSI